MGAVSLNVKYITIKDKASLDKPVKLTAHPIPLLIKLRKLPTAVKAFDKSGKAFRIKLSIGVNIKETKPIIKEIIPFKIELIINLTPLFRHGLGF